MKTDFEVSIPAEWIARADSLLDWVWQPTQIAGRTISLAVAADPDAMLLDACRRQDEGEEGVIDPFWATTWRAASGLDRFLDRLDLSDQAVLEVGCGTGHAGVAAALRGGDVVLTDGMEDPLHLVRLSLAKAKLDCPVGLLRFGRDQLERKFPIILGSDVTYLRELWPVLDTCLAHHLEIGGAVYLSDPFRFISNEFRDWISTRPWTYREHRIEMEDQPKHPIRVMELCRGEYEVRSCRA